MKDKPRIGTVEWIHARPNAAAVFNIRYDHDGLPVPELAEDPTPWTVITPDGEWESFATQPQALAYALNPQEAGKTA